MPAADLALLRRAAHQAGDIALRYWRKQPQIWDKPDGQGPVTEADLAINAWLEEHLRAARPDYGWLSEESADDPARLSARRVFIVDPIDGTRAFIDGQEGFSHSLAIAENGRIIAGVVYLPARNATYAATISQSATLNGQRITASTTGLQDATLLTAKAALQPQFWTEIPPVKREFCPSLAWRLCLVAEGRYDATLTVRPAWEWDIAAGSLIAQQAGCQVTDLRGQTILFNSRRAQQDGFVIAAPSLHDALIRRLRPPFVLPN